MSEAAKGGAAPAAKGAKGLVQALFGQFTTKDFWIDLTRSLVQQAISAFLMTLGGVLYWYGKEKFDVKKGGPPPSGAADPTDVSRKAFGGGFSPSPSYDRETEFRPGSYPVRTSGGDGRFPGFGG